MTYESKEVEEKIDRFKEYSLTGLLDDGVKLTIDTQSRILTLSDTSILEQATFPDTEYRVLTTLLEYFPREKMLSVHTGASVASCIRHINEAESLGDVTIAMRPATNAISRTRARLLPFGIDISTIMHTGYLLVARTRKMKNATIL